MEYEILDDKIIVKNADTFTPEGALASGQVFRFGCKENGVWWVNSGGYHAEIESIAPQNYIIHTKNPNFFANYFDFYTNYDMILSRLGKFEILGSALEYGKGVRLLRQPLVEVIVDFIISANNNIPRIRNSVTAIATNFGQKMEWGYAFPDLGSLKQITEKDFVKFGCGYRAPYLVETIQKISEPMFLENLSKLKTLELRKELLKLKGIGPKVADCILLFGFNRFDVFPVDTWIDKVYHEDFKGLETKREKIAEWFVQTFGMDSGYCQQYLFYYKRKNINLK